MRFIFAFLLLLLSSPAGASSIKPDENIVFFTTEARQDGGEWVVPVHAWVFEPEEGSLRRRAAVSALAKSFDLDDSAADNAIFRERAMWFLVDNEGGKQVHTAPHDAGMETTGPNGHARGQFRIALPPEDRVFGFSAVLPDGDGRSFTGNAVLVPEQGVSVISDIDDTIKISEVTDKKKLLENTFVKPFAPSPGMVDAYQRLAASGAVFHYVSSSPWQLYPALKKFMDDEKFPLGGVHLRVFRVKDDSIFNMLKSSTETKPPVINKLLSDYPKREFIMIGDSGEHDPEIYGKIARENPGRVKHIYIRRVTSETAQDARYAKAFEGLDAATWTVFDDAGVIRP